MMPDSMTQPQAVAWANLRLRFVKTADQFTELRRTAEHYSLALYTIKGLSVGDFEESPGGRVRYQIDEGRFMSTLPTRLSSELRFA